MSSVDATAAYPPYMPPAAPKRRPIGVTILAVLTILLGVLIAIVGIILLLAPLVVAGLGIPTIFGLAVGVLGGIVLIFGVIFLAVGSGLLNLRPWAWWLAIVVTILWVIGSLGSGLYVAAIPGLIFVYLFLVRQHFR
jgi:hypothetical protein